MTPFPRSTSTPHQQTAFHSSHYLDRARCLYDAFEHAVDLAPAAIQRETGYALETMIKGLLPGLLQIIVLVSATTVLGAGVGGAIGFLFGGVGAAPGAVIGGELGFEAGMALLTWLGLAFLAVSIVQGFGEMLDSIKQGIQAAWDTPDHPEASHRILLRQAAQKLADAAGIFFRLLLQGIVAYLLKESALQSTQRAVAVVGQVRALGTEAVAADISAGLVVRLRASRLGGPFADWVEKNLNDLLRNPRLRPRIRPPEPGGAGSSSGQPAAPTQSAAEPPKAPPKPAPKPVVPANLNDLKPNTTYEANGYTFKTDSQGRINSVEGRLRLEQGERNPYRQRTVGGADRMPSDQGGHMIATRFDGPGDLVNLQPQDANLNMGAWKQMENEWADALNQGKTVDVQIEPVFEGASTRPTEFEVQYEIDGQVTERTFKNAPGGK